MAVSQYMTLPL